MVDFPILTARVLVSFSKACAEDASGFSFINLRRATPN